MPSLCLIAKASGGFSLLEPSTCAGKSGGMASLDPILIENNRKYSRGKRQGWRQSYFPQQQRVCAPTKKSTMWRLHYRSHCSDKVGNCLAQIGPHNSEYSAPIGCNSCHWYPRWSTKWGSIEKVLMYHITDQKLRCKSPTLSKLLKSSRKESYEKGK